MTFHSSDSWIWHFAFILIAGWAVTDVWRYLGVYFGGRLSHKSEALVLVRTIATALVAAVIGNQIVFPSGALAQTTLALRLGAMIIGFVVFLWFGKRMLVAIIVAEAILLAGMALGF